jgi:DNA-binding transcriptional ArsR family regulator
MAMPRTLDDVLSSLADPTRRAVVERLLRGSATPGELAREIPAATPQALSHHLSVLEGAGLIFRTREAQRRPCHIDPRGLRIAVNWIDRNRPFWEGSFDRLAQFLSNEEETESDR